MAFLVCYSVNPPHDHIDDKAVYLEQSFYELLYGHCRDKPTSFATLGDIALLRYKSPVHIIQHEQLSLLQAELQKLEGDGVRHDQISEFLAVCSMAYSRGCALTISADMYPELGRADFYGSERKH